MRNKKKSLFDFLEKHCTKKVRICTMKFCATGCLNENYDDDNIVCLNDVDIVFTDGVRELEHRENLCICDDYILSFEAIK
jgi:hypothetical protein